MHTINGKEADRSRSFHSTPSVYIYRRIQPRPFPVSLPRFWHNAVASGTLELKVTLLQQKTAADQTPVRSSGCAALFRQLQHFNRLGVTCRSWLEHLPWRYRFNGQGMHGYISLFRRLVIVHITNLRCLRLCHALLGRCSFGCPSWDTRETTVGTGWTSSLLSGRVCVNVTWIVSQLVFALQ